jgi:hypothetical protein
MRAFVCGSSWIIAAALAGGCSSTGAKPDATAPAAPADQAVAASPCVMQAGGVNVLRLTAPPDLRCAATDGALRFVAKQYEVEFWLVPGAQTVDEATGRVPQQIASEFKDFKPDHTTDLTVAGSPAKRLVGTGHEADDGDDGGAGVIVFKVGDHVFVACNHDEKLSPAGQDALLALVQTAQAP